MTATGAFWAGGGIAIDRSPPREPEDLAARVALGDREAFATLYGAHAEPVARLCRRLLGSEEEAQDARSEVFLRAREAIASYDPRRPFRSWLLAIASHHCIDRLRRRALEGRLFAPAELAEDTLPESGPTPLGSALLRERRDQLLAALDALAPRQRAPLVLRYFAELAYDEIAVLLGVSTRDVGVLLFRAKLRLREELAGGGFA
jgi:RNA polymerase sigma-70 factor (ECF subfamily)